MEITTAELFCGTKSFSKVAVDKGFNTLTIDNDTFFNPTLCVNILDYQKSWVLTQKDILWASPPCTTFSVASIGRHWCGGLRGYEPKSESSRIGLLILEKTIFIIADTKPRIWFIENPRGMMRKVIDDIFKKHNITEYRRVTVSYCQYGDTRMKPTDIWTNNFKWVPRLICKNGDKCHISAPRGSKTGTQGLKNAKERGIIPPELMREVLECSI